MQQAYDVAEGVDALMKELDELAVEGLAPGEAEVRGLYIEVNGQGELVEKERMAHRPARVHPYTCRRGRP